MANITLQREIDIPANNGCVLCLNQREMWAALVYLLYTAAKQTPPTSADDLLADSGCFRCVNDKEALGAVINCLSTYVVNNDFATSEEIMAGLPCLNCTDTHTLQLAAAEWFCVMMASGVIPKTQV